MNALLVTWLTAGEWRSYPVRLALSILAIAVGVALGYAVHLVNDAALLEMDNALHTLSGDADVSLVAATPDGFPEGLFPQLATRQGVAMASPVIDRSLALAEGQGTIEILGIDPLRAAAVTPGLLPRPAAPGNPATVFGTQNVFLSPAALGALHLEVGQSLEILVKGARVGLFIAGTVPGANAGARLGVMDIGAAQWRLGMLGQLSRLDLKLSAGVSPERFAQSLVPDLPAGVRLVMPTEQDARSDSLSRAYRVNLDMLALMALFTGAFLVYSTQSLSVARRATQGALLRVIGVPRSGLLAQVLCEGALLGAVGSLVGLAAGLGLAALALRLLGGDLGGGYFAGLHPRLQFAPLAAVAFFVLGVGAALVGSFLPARAASRAHPAIVLKAAGESQDPRTAPPVRLSVVLLCLGACFTLLPALGGIAVFGYLAMALLLFGGIALMPWLAHRTLAPLAGSSLGRLPVPLELALKRLWGAPTQGAVALCGIVAATSLMVAMGIMVTSFRQSVDAWVERLLPAALYLHIDAPIESVGLDRPTEETLAALPGVSSIDFLRMVPLQLSASRAPVALLARSMPDAGPGDTLFMVAQRPIPKGAIPVWISEAVRDLYGSTLGDAIRLPLNDPNGTPRTVTVFVAGIWRDYARQAGAIVMRDADYTRLTGDARRGDAGIHTLPGTDLGALEERIRGVLPAALRAHVQFARPADIRATSLRIFDRSFAVTYVLEAVAMGIGLIGVAATFSAQTVARAREFGMLRHVGVLRRQIVQMLSWEGALLGAMGVGAGVLLGAAMSQILIHVVNPQSFHWTMDTHIPWLLLVVVGALLMAASAGTAALAGREAISSSAILAVREDA